MENHLRMILGVTIKAAWDDKMQKNIAKASRMSKLDDSGDKDSDRYSDTSSSDTSDLNLYKIDSNDSSSSFSDTIKPKNRISANFFKGDTKTGDFVRRFRSTQMFCSYCETEATKRRKMIDVEKDISEFNEGKLSDNDFIDNESTFIHSSIESTDGIIPSAGVKLEEQGTNIRKFQKGSTEKNDPLVCMMTILLTGTIPLDTDKILSLERTYANPATKSERFIKKYGLNSDSLSITCGDNEFKNINRRKCTVDGEYKYEKNLESEILWCNGRCMGRADTGQCTLLCLSEWEKKVRTTQHQLAIKELFVMVY